MSITKKANDMPTIELFDDDLPDFEVIDFTEIDESESMIPGSNAVMTADEIEETKEKLTDWINDGDHMKFLPYFEQRLSKVPPHKGDTVSGCERACAYLEALVNEAKKALRSDTDGKIDDTKCEKLVDKAYKDIKKLQDHLKKLSKKYASSNTSDGKIKIGKKVYPRLVNGDTIQYYISVASGDSESLLEVEIDEPTSEQIDAFMKSEAQLKDFKLNKTAAPSLLLVEDPFIHAITRMIINAHVTYGKNIEEVYASLDDQYKFTPRDHLSIHEILKVKGMNLNQDFTRLFDKDVKPFDGKGFNTDTTYSA